MWRVAHFAALGWPIGAGNRSRFFHCLKSRRVFLPLLVLPVRSVRITAGEGLIGSHAMPGGDHHKCASLLLEFLHFSLYMSVRRNEQAPKCFEKALNLSDEAWRAEILYPLTATYLYYITAYLLPIIAFLLATRCASRGREFTVGWAREDEAKEEAPIPARRDIWDHECKGKNFHHNVSSTTHQNQQKTAFTRPPTCLMENLTPSDKGRRPIHCL